METVMGQQSAQEIETPTPQQGERASWTQHVLIGVAGPCTMGACLGLHNSVQSTVMMTLAMPFIVVLLGALTLPGLYIGSALLGQDLSVKQMAQVALKTVDAMGSMMLGLAPAVLFLSSTSGSVDESIILTTLALGLGSVLGLRSFWSHYSPHITSAQALVPFGIWTITSIGLGWQLYLSALRMGGLI